jgi:DNA-binding NtrC family response regulator
MSAQVVLVHSDPQFVRACEAALRSAGHHVEVFSDSMSALNRLEQPDHVDVLVTRIRFPLGQPNGVALANMARVKKPGIRIILTSVPELADHAEGLGIVLQAPVRSADAVEAVRRTISEQQGP